MAATTTLVSVVRRRDRIQDPYPIGPVHLCVEILSPEDRMSAVVSKCEEYHAWGVIDTWIVDPDDKCAWIYRKGQRLFEVPPGGSLTADGTSIPLADILKY